MFNNIVKFYKHLFKKDMKENVPFLSFLQVSFGHPVNAFTKVLVPYDPLMFWCTTVLWREFAAFLKLKDDDCLAGHPVILGTLYMMPCLLRGAAALTGSSPFAAERSTLRHLRDLLFGNECVADGHLNSPCGRTCDMRCGLIRNVLSF
ncbi:hypothetical protein ILYODFUR_034968 [Ilyodon furcidens]|uniref:Uncharacterized protein n=1 Tax=Ilyodon furcidens TaxID=33524 RepID=A0ABV0U1E8_9TELE